MISIVMAYYNRKPQLLNTLKTIGWSKKAKDIEVIIVDDGSDGDHRLEDIFDKFSFELKVIRKEKKDKWYTNPCVPFNVGIKEAKGSVVIIQNPECAHAWDVPHFASYHLTEENYLSFSAYSTDATGIGKIKRAKSYSDIDNEFRPKVNSVPEVLGEGVYCWYNHPVYRPVGYHFCAAITKNNLDELGGFDERYAAGNGYDDNEILARIKRKGLEVKIVDTPYVLHQYHKDYSPFFEKGGVELVYKNRALFEEVTMKEQGWRMDNG